jgi:Ca2+-binding RTX toxin-like protein
MLFSLLPLLLFAGFAGLAISTDAAGDGAPPDETDTNIPSNGFTIGDDSVNGTDGNDILNAGDGDDQVTGEAGNDTIHLGNGDDTSGTLPDILGERPVSGSADFGNDTVFGDAGNDVIRDGAGSNTLSGGDGDDTIYGIDTATDTNTPDILLGGAGADHLFGDAGDTMTGGDGSDTYTVYAQDFTGSPVTITDLGADDHLVLAVAADPGITPTLQLSDDGLSTFVLLGDVVIAHLDGVGADAGVQVSLLITGATAPA